MRGSVSPIRQRGKTRAVLVLLFAAAAVVGVALVVGPHLSQSSAARDAASATHSQGPKAVAMTSTPLGPATVTAPYTIKAEPKTVATDSPRPTPSSGRAVVVLSYATFDAHSRTVQASGYAAGVIEDGGTCTLTLTKGPDVVTASSAAGADETTTTCGLLQTPAGLASGRWAAVLTYSSRQAEGRSGTQEVTVP